MQYLEVMMSDLTEPGDPIIELLQKQTDLLQMNLVQQLRVYDLLLTLVRQGDKKDAQKILDMHADWKYIGPLPFKETEDE